MDCYSVLLTENDTAKLIILRKRQHLRESPFFPVPSRKKQKKFCNQSIKGEMLPLGQIDILTVLWVAKLLANKHFQVCWS